MNLSDFDFDLPEALIATRPARALQRGFWSLTAMGCATFLCAIWWISFAQATGSS